MNEMTFYNEKEGHPLKTMMPNQDPRSQWRWEGNKIINQVGEVLDVKGASKHEGAELCSYKHNGQNNQQWRKEIVY